MEAKKKKYKAMVKALQSSEQTLKKQLEHAQQEAAELKLQVSSMQNKSDDERTKMKELKQTIRELKCEVQNDRSQQKSQSSFAMLSEQNGISITAISLTELESLKTRIHELKREVDENKQVAT